MKIEIDLPHAMELVALTVAMDNNKITLEPRNCGQKRMVRVAYVQAVGDSGNKENIALMFNANSGKFFIRRFVPQAEAERFPFDSPLVPVVLKPVESKPESPASGTISTGGVVR